MRVSTKPLGNPNFVSVRSVPLLTPEQCDQILGMCASQWEPAGVTGYGKDRKGSIRPDVRSVLSQVLPLGAGAWPLPQMAETVAAVNDETYRFRLDNFLDADPPSVLRYESGTVDHFQAHRDVGPDFPTRKLSCIVQLSDPKSYQGGSLVFLEEHAIAATEQGVLTIFPSFLVHQVTPVVAGERFVLVAWVHGPTFC